MILVKIVAGDPGEQVYMRVRNVGMQTKISFPAGIMTFISGDGHSIQP